LSETNHRSRAYCASPSWTRGAVAPPLLGGLLVLLAIQVPLAFGLARRLQRGHEERERLLARAIEASDNERRRIAADLHDGIVQDLAGVAFGLAPLAAKAPPSEQKVLNASVERLRQGVRDLRTLLVEIHPPRLESAGLEAALDDLLSPLRAAGVETELEVAPTRDDTLAYRVVREALRNVLEHAGARHVIVSVTPQGATIRDDGRGFDAAQRQRRRDEGHVGLALLHDLVTEAGGTLAVRSAPGLGTTVTLEFPT
jgi:signal transduction histidine kinase